MNELKAQVVITERKQNLRACLTNGSVEFGMRLLGCNSLRTDLSSCSFCSQEWLLWELLVFYIKLKLCSVCVRARP